MSLQMSEDHHSHQPHFESFQFESGARVEVVSREVSPASPLGVFEAAALGWQFFVYSRSVDELGRHVYGLRHDCGMICRCEHPLPSRPEKEADKYASLRLWELLEAVYSGFPADSLKLINNDCIERNLYAKSVLKIHNGPTLQSLPWRNNRK
jgi:hypothetical protein